MLSIKKYIIDNVGNIEYNRPLYVIATNFLLVNFKTADFLCLKLTVIFSVNLFPVCEYKIDLSYNQVSS